MKRAKYALRHRVSATCVRYPSPHSESIWVEQNRSSVSGTSKSILNSRRVVLNDNPAEKEYLCRYSYQAKTIFAVGRIRKDISNANGLAFGVSGDQIRKGAALNAVHAEYLIKVTSKILYFASFVPC